MSQIGASQFEAPMGSVFQKYEDDNKSFLQPGITHFAMSSPILRQRNEEVGCARVKLSVFCRHDFLALMCKSLSKSGTSVQFGDLTTCKLVLNSVPMSNWACAWGSP